MKYLYYLPSGLVSKRLGKEYTGFYIAEYAPCSKFSRTQYYYPNDSIITTISENLCIRLYDYFKKTIFSSPQEYDNYYPRQTELMWIVNAGLDSQSKVSKKQLEALFATPLHQNYSDENVTEYRAIDALKFKYAYAADCFDLVDTLQELLLGSHHCFIQFYKSLSTLPCVHAWHLKDGTYTLSGGDTIAVYSFLYSIIIKLYSSFDILTKIAYEIENLKNAQEEYPKFASKGILFGDKKKLHFNFKTTVFDKSRSVSIIESLRNEIVHNASWETNSKIFVSVKNHKVVKKSILLPDFTESGTLETYKNRKRFFSQGKTVNDELPDLYFDILNRIVFTLVRILSNNIDDKHYNPFLML